jgi:hypothetical protein
MLRTSGENSDPACDIASKHHPWKNATSSQKPPSDASSTFSKSICLPSRKFVLGRLGHKGAWHQLAVTSTMERTTTVPTKLTEKCLAH